MIRIIILLTTLLITGVLHAQQIKKTTVIESIIEKTYNYTYSLEAGEDSAEAYDLFNTKKITFIYNKSGNLIDFVDEGRDDPEQYMKYNEQNQLIEFDNFLKITYKDNLPHQFIDDYTTNNQPTYSLITFSYNQENC